MDISDHELVPLNFYRSSELHGGLILGQLARRAREPKLLRNLTAHAAEEMVHAQLWTACIHMLGGTPRPVRDTYQTRYAQAVGTPTTMLEVLVLTHVFERRVHRHFTRHLKRAGTHRKVQRVLQRMLHDERDHLSWVRRWLSSQDDGAVRRTMARYAEADETIYAALCHDYEFTTGSRG